MAVSCRFVLVVGNSLIALGGSPVQGRIIHYIRDESTVGGALIVYIISGMDLLFGCTDCVYYIRDGSTEGVQ